MRGLLLLRVSVHERISAAAEDFLLQVETREEAQVRFPGLRPLLTERLTAAAEEIIGVFEETVTKYKDRVERSEREVHRLRKLFEAVLKPEVRLYRADVQHPIGTKEEQQWNPLEDHQYAHSPHVKEEQQELWVSQDGEKLHGLEEADIKSTLIVAEVKSEEDEENPQSSQLHQSQTEEDTAHCGGPEPVDDPGPDGHLQPGHAYQTGDSSETEHNEDERRETRKHESSLNLHSNRPTESAKRSQMDKRPFSCSECGKQFKQKHKLMVHELVHTGEAPFSCSECGKVFRWKFYLNTHMMIHTGEKPFSCSDCGKTFRQKYYLNRHVTIHTGEKPFSCSECGKEFRQKPDLNKHMRIHRGEKPFSCSECGKDFRQKSDLNKHMTIHTGVKPFSCSECGSEFRQNSVLKEHMKIHRREKPFHCSECGKEFRQNSAFKEHMKIHRREKPFYCSDCGQGFRCKFELKKHLSIHTGEKPYSCSDCGREFRSKRGLKRHAKIHS